MKIIDEIVEWFKGSKLSGFGINSFLLIVLNLLSLGMVGQTSDFSTYSFKPDKNYIKSYWTATKKIAIAPIHWQAKEWKIAGSVAIIGATLYIFDNDIRTIFQSNQNATLDFAAKYIFEPFGSGIYPAVLFGGYYIYGLAAKNKRARRITLGAVQTYLLAGVSAQVFKYAFHRHRPYQDIPANPHLWEGPFNGGWQYVSFPSGHTTAAFALASLMSSVYKDKKWVGLVSYGIATGVGLSRIYDDMHWSTDVFIGAALGFAIGKTVFYIMDKGSKLSMGISNNGGVALTYKID